MKTLLTYLLFALGFFALDPVEGTAQAKIIVTDGKVVMQNSAYLVTSDVSVNSGGLMTVDNSTLKVAGSITSSNTIDVQTGTVEMNGSSTQTIPANAFKVNKIKNLIISNNVNLAGEDSLTGILSFGSVNSKTFATGGYLTLKSTASGTASVADITNSNTNSGNVVTGSVNTERYLTAIKKWRFLSIPTSTTQTIREAWQENCSTASDCLAGYGTQITGVAGTAAGFDLYSSQPSMKTYSTSTNTFTGVPSTTGTAIDNPVNNTNAYFLFVRGDRTAANVSSSVTQTTLRTRGAIRQGTQTAVTVFSPTTAFTPVGNPYPSRIDLRKMTPAPTPSTKIYVWDPLLYGTFGFGAYQTLTFDGSDFTATPGGGSYGAPINQNPNYIESGNAFLVGGNSSDYTITFKEEIKPSISNLINVPVRLGQSITANLFLQANNAYTLADGTKADISVNYSNQITDDDAVKLNNSSENVSIKRGQRLFAVERYQTISHRDTFQLNIANMRVQKYQWEVSLKNVLVPGMNAFFVDKYKNLYTPLTANGTVQIPFSIENVPGSYAADRFMIVFQPEQRRKYFSFIKVDAFKKPSGINIAFSVTNDSLISRYLVQRSTDGTNFYTVYSIPHTNWNTDFYQWLDANVPGGDYTYRIQGVNEDNDITYSREVAVNEDDFFTENIGVYPNPLVNGVINYQIKNQPAGIYEMRVLNLLGETMMVRQINHAGGSSKYSFDVHSNLPKGVYTIETITPSNKKVFQKIIN